MRTAPADFIIERQTAWARRQGIALQGSRGVQGRQVYTSPVEFNLFEPLSPEAGHEYSHGDGGELGSRRVGTPGKMQALHSSSALCCNVFHYWRRIEQRDVIAAACGLPRGSASVKFEQQFPIDSSRFRRAPNLDAAFRYERGPINLIGIESKFCEPFSTRGHAGLSAKYLGDGCAKFWERMPALQKLARQISPTNEAFDYLDAAQLLKHLLGLQQAAPRFKLLYLYYAVPGPAGAEHAAEVEKFIAVAAEDGVAVSAASYQDVIVRLLRLRGGEDTAYLNYISERYL
jgi:hypothetical protein